MFRKLTLMEATKVKNAIFICILTRHCMLIVGTDHLHLQQAGKTSVLWHCRALFSTARTDGCVLRTTIFDKWTMALLQKTETSWNEKGECCPRSQNPCMADRAYVETAKRWGFLAVFVSISRRKPRQNFGWRIFTVKSCKVPQG